MILYTIIALAVLSEPPTQTHLNKHIFHQKSKTQFVSFIKIIINSFQLTCNHKRSINILIIIVAV